MTRVYASLPLTGPSGPPGCEVLRGAELALEQANDSEVDLVVLESSGDDRDARAEANARRVAADGEAVAYLGDFHSSQVLVSAPPLSQAGILQVAPVATLTGLSGPTLVRLTPDDAALGRAIAAWLVSQGVGTLLLVHDHDAGYGIPVGAMCAEAARARGIDVRSRPVWDAGEDVAADVRGTGAVLYVGVAGSGAVGLWHDLHTLDGDLWLLGTDGVAVPWLAEKLDHSAAGRTRFFTAHRAPWGFYGFEAMRLILDAIGAGGGTRAGTVRAARATRDRPSVIGRYSIDKHGGTTGAADGRLRVVDGALVWDAIRAG